MIETTGPMNAVAKDDAMAYLGLTNETHLTPIEEKQLRAKKKKIVRSSKKMDRRVSKEISRHVDRLK